MSTEQTWQIESTSSADTFALGEQIGSKLLGGEVIELIGDLGSGKTTFVKGLAKGMGSSDHVHSPSFNIENIYQSNRLMLHHFDLYRLNDPGLITDELGELLDDEQIVIVIEWAGNIDQSVLGRRMTITFGSTDTEQHRVLTAHLTNQTSHLSLEV